MLQSKAGYIDARPLTASSAKPLATHGRTIQLGQKRRFGDISVTSVLPLKADIRRMVRHVRKVPKADKLTSQFDQSPCLLFHATPPSWAIALRPDERSRQP